MKNKITKLFLAVLTIVLGGSAHAQDQQMPAEVRAVTNVEYLAKLAKEKEAAYQKNYKIAVEIAKQRNMPIEGENEDGTSFVLRRYDEETDALIYVGTFEKKQNSNTSFFNNVTTGSSLQTANAKPLHTDNIIGAGMIVGVWDGGAGLPNHLAFQGGRYQIKNNANNGADAEGKDHAAHVAGTVGAAAFGDGRAKGFAYGATIHAYNGINQYDIAPMIAAAGATTNTMYVSNHSYGLYYEGSPVTSSIFGQYNVDAKEYDEVANNAPYYTIVFAAGNDRGKAAVPQKSGGKDLLSQAGVSKNTVVVAATRGTEDFSGITGLTSVQNVGGVGPFIANYSSYGPTDDFRIKPDIAAKGGQDYVNDLVLSVGDANTAATASMQGTSMAAPAVTGVFTLWQGHYKSVFDTYMRSASVRALMAHTAREAGPATGPDFMFGWGLIDADKGRQIIDQAEVNTAIFEEIDLPQGSNFDYDFTYDGVDPLIVTIAWNDPAGTVTSQTDLNLKKLVNDLDLRLINTDNNTVYYPWSLVQNWNITPTSTNIAVRNVDNARDNIEKIEPVNAVAGNYNVQVTHKGNLSGGNQNFSIIISGAGGQMPSTEDSVSTEDIYFESLKVYPNPVEDFITINGNLVELSNATIDVFDMSGKKVLESKVSGSSTMSVNVAQLNTGNYIMIIAKDGKRQEFKFVKK